MCDGSDRSFLRPGGESGSPRPAASVWATGQRDLHTQLAEGGYVTGTTTDEGAVPPAVAAYAIAAYTRPGAVVLDPDCGAGTVLFEAVRVGRHAIGLTAESHWATLVRANLAAARRDGAAGHGAVLRHRVAIPYTAHQTALGVGADLLLTAVGARPPDAADPVDAASATVAHVQALLADCRSLLRPSAYVVLAFHPWRHHGHLVDLSSHLVAIAASIGLVPVQRCVALSAAVQGDRLVSHAGLALRRNAARQERISGHPVCLTVHRDVFVFRARAVAAVAGEVRSIAPSPLRVCHRAPAWRAA